MKQQKSFPVFSILYELNILFELLLAEPNLLFKIWPKLEFRYKEITTKNTYTNIVLIQSILSNNYVKVSFSNSHAFK